MRRSSRSHGPPVSWRLAAALIVLLVALPFGLVIPALAQADMPDAPELADAVVADSLSSETVFAPGGCPSGRARGHYVDEGFRLEVTGACRQGSDSAEVAVLGRVIELPDGEASVAFKVVRSTARTGVSLYARIAGRDSVGAYVNQGTGEVTLFKMVDGQWSGLGTRTDGRALLNLDDWNRLGLRLAGSEVWLMLNGQPAIYSAELTPGVGGIGLRLVREGRVDDAEPAAAVFADLLVSPLADGDPGRSPAGR